MRTAPQRRSRPRPGALHTRLLLSFLAPVLLLAAGGSLLLARPAGRGFPSGGGLVIFAGFGLAAVVLATALAVSLGDRLARPVSWLLRMMESGQLRLITQQPPPAGNWEMDALLERVQVLLKQNLSGARAMEELETLRREMSALLEAAAASPLDPDAWPPERAGHPLMRRLLDYFRRCRESQRDAADGLTRLQGLLEQDWREETLAVEEIAKRSERCFLEQTEMALELERIEKLARPGGGPAAPAEDPAQILQDLRTSLRRWRGELDGALEGSHPLRARLQAWDAWVDESLRLLEGSSARGDSGNGAGRLAPRLERAARSASKAGQEIGALSCEAAQLQRNWARLGERLRSLLARVGEVREGDVANASGTEGGTEGDRGE
jgi:uncharacterized coiled-coil protein SlyX